MSTIRYCLIIFFIITTSSITCAANKIPTASYEVDTAPFEGNVNHTSYFLLEINQPLAKDASVAYKTIDGTAKVDEDYLFASGRAIIPAGQVSTTVPITIIGDAIYEGDEDFFLEISDPQGAKFPVNITKIQAKRTIKDDDQNQLLLATATSDSIISLAWKPLNNTIYEVYASTIDGFTPDPKTFISTYDNIYKAEVSGLIPNTTYYFKIVSSNTQGIQNVSNQMSATTFAQTPQINTSISFVSSLSSNLSDATVNNANSLSIPLIGAEQTPKIGDILAGKTVEGTGYIRQIDNITTTTNKLQLITSKTSLDKVLPAGSIDSTIQLFDINNSTSSPQATVRYRRHLKTDNTEVSQMDWDDDLLTIIQTRHASTSPDFSLQPKSQANQYQINIKPSYKKNTFQQTRFEPAFTTQTEATGAMDVAADIKFEPKIKSKMNWDKSKGLQTASFTASGTLDFTLTAKYDFKAQATINTTPKTLLTKSYYHLYFIGGVPVWQKTSLILDVQFSAGVNGEIKASTQAKASLKASISTHYTNGQWTTTSTPITLTPSLNTDLSVKGSVTAEVRFIPRIEVQFYEAVGMDLSIEPYLNGKIEYSIVNKVDLLKGSYAPTFLGASAFDVNLGIQCHISANTSEILGNTPLMDKIEVCARFAKNKKIEYPLFSLPKIILSSKDETDSTVTVSAKVTDGKFNPIKTDGIYWHIKPDGLAYTVKPTSAKIADVQTFSINVSNPANITPQNPYTVFFTGNGNLGAWGTQIHSTDINMKYNISCDDPRFVSTKDVTYQCTDNGLGQLTVDKSITGGGFGKKIILKNGIITIYEDYKCLYNPQNCLYSYALQTNNLGHKQEKYTYYKTFYIKTTFINNQLASIKTELESYSDYNASNAQVNNPASIIYRDSRNREYIIDYAVDFTQKTFPFCTTPLYNVSQGSAEFSQCVNEVNNKVEQLKARVSPMPSPPTLETFIAP